MDIDGRPEAVQVGLEETEIVFVRDGDALSLMLMEPLLETLVL